MTVGAALWDLLLPARCPACDAVATPVLCGGCAAELERLALPDLARTTLAEGVLAVGAYAYDGIAADIVRGVKAGERHAAATGLGHLLRARLNLPSPWQVPTTWVPSTRRRRRERGVEVPHLLAGPGARRLVAKVAERPDQTDMDPVERRRSPIGAFAATGPVPPAVILIDDVRTTGATALAAATALQQGGAQRVVVATFAVAGDQARAGLALGRR
jgi:predicted amidophosphoribosyltransferase